MSKVLELLGTSSSTIKVLSARGVDAVRDTLDSVVRALVPVIVNDSPYADRVVALIDQPHASDAPNAAKLAQDLGDRLYVLETASIEQYIPEAVYGRAHRSREDDLRNLNVLQGRYQELRALKRDISTALAGALTVDDLDAIPIIANAARRAIAAA